MINRVRRAVLLLASMMMLQSVLVVVPAHGRAMATFAPAGPGGPILVVSSAANPFSSYYTEILRNEGLNAFSAVDIAGVDATLLADYEVVILGEMAVNAAQAGMFADWVTGGGNLIAMRPDADLGALLGLTDSSTDLSEAYIKIDTAAGRPGAGLVSQTIQFHGTADRYAASAGTDVLATLYSDANTSTSNPAVTVRSVGSNGGQAAAFTFDLARSVVETRQGNPAWAGQERDGQQPPIKRSDDLFFPDWVDFSKIQIPQADEQQRLLANLIEDVNRDHMPLPRFWYFPRGEKAVVVMTGDDHANNGTAGQFDWDISVSPSGCDVSNWECVRGTSYMYPNTPITDAAAAAYQAQGFELGLHVNTDCADWTSASLPDFYTDQLAAYAAAFPSLTAPTTNRTHCITWSDWATQPKVELSNGIRLDTSYYYWPAAWVQNRPGYFTGSGMPMRFADLDGSLIDVYQAATQMTDESDIDYSSHINTLLDNALGAAGYYGVVTTNMHTDTGPHPGQQIVVQAALARGVPVVSAEQMKTWLDGRNASSFGNLAWNDGTMTFSIAAGAGSNGLQAMLPTRGANGSLQTLRRGTSNVAFDTQTVKGIEYAVFTAGTGAYTATYDVDTSAPDITGIAAVPGGDGTAIVTWTTNEPSTSRVDYGQSAADLASSASLPALTTAHQIQLTGLLPSTTYHFRVSSTDGSGLTSVAPAPPTAPAAFSTPGAVATDTTVAQFGAGTTGSSTYVSDTAGGEVVLAPTVGAEFQGTSLPTGWSTGTWTGGNSAVAAGRVSVDGSWIRSNQLVGAGRAVEFAATFSGDSFQNAGLGVTLETTSGESWAMFGTNGTSGVLQARTLGLDGSIVDVPLGAQFIGSQHVFRIEWDTAVRFFVDGALVHTAATVDGTMRPIASDYNTGSGALVVDWMRMTPYSSAGTFLSRIHDAGSAGDWGALSYVADVPTGSTLTLSVRRGDTPTPDATWSAFTPSAQGHVVGGPSRYVQYRVELTSSGDVTPALSSVTLPFTASLDTAPPSVVGRAPAPDATAVSVGTNVDVTFDEPLDPATITNSTITLRAQGAGTNVSAAVTYAGATATLDPTAELSADTTYIVTVAASVTDASGNSLGAADSWSFHTSAALSQLRDTTTADFAAGSTGGDTYVTSVGDGEIVLAPTAAAEFDGTTLPADWTSTSWTEGSGGSTVTGGSVAVDGALLATTGQFGPGRSLEFVATFGAAGFQHAGFGVDVNNVARWAMFSTFNTTDTLYTRTHNGSEAVNSALTGSFIGSPHRYRIDWLSDRVVFSIDGTVVHTELVAIAGDMRPLVSDFNAGGPAVGIDWMRMTPYASAGTFTSRVLDAGEMVDWETLAATTSVPTGTGVGFQTRSGNSTNTAEASWSAWQALGATIASPDARFIQYRAVLTTNDPSTTASVEQVALTYVPAPDDETAPTITTRAPAPNATGVEVATTVEAGFSEAIEPATVTGNSVRLRAQGAASDVGATVSMSGSSAVVIDPVVDLAPYTTYTVTITTAVTDLSGNALAGPATWSFATGGITANFIDTTGPDFAAGTTGASTYVADTAGGEIVLAPSAGAEFGGSALPTGWTAKPTPWTPGGAASVASGALAVDGSMVGTTSTFGPGSSLEFVATFSAQAFQHVGFVADLDFNDPWVIVSTGNAGAGVFARTSTNPSGVSLGEGLLGSSHRYRIDWTATGFDFSVDGTFVLTMPVPSNAAMLVGASDANLGTPLVVDWMRLSPYASAGTFVSRVFDAGAPTTWTSLTPAASKPAGTTVAFETRTGGSTDPADGTWSNWTPVDGTSIGSPASRYIQYRIELTTTDPTTSPVVQSVQLASTALPAQAPTTTITSAPPAVTSSTGATFAFQSDDAAAAFECRLDGSPWADCTSPRLIVGLSGGTHVFEVRARAGGLVDATPAAAEWTVDITPPSLVVTTPTAGAVYTVGQVVTPAGTCTDTRDAAPTSSLGTVNTSTATTSPRTFTATCSDSVGNTQTVTLTYSVTAAVTTTREVRWSTSRSRTGPQRLDGASVAGLFAAFLTDTSGRVITSSSGVRSVRFRIISPSGTSVVNRSDASAPYDAGGTTSGLSVLLDTSTWRNGSYRLETTITPTTGAATVLTSTFTLANVHGPSQLRWSTSTGRTSSVPVQAATLRGRVAIFLTTNAFVVQRVRYYLDGSTNPYSTRTQAPYDLASSTAQRATLVDVVRVFGRGSHSIRVVVDYRDGTSDTTQVTFTVA